MKTRRGLLHTPELFESLLASDQLVSFYQPIVSLRAQDIYGYESLCRIQGTHPFDSIEELFFYARHLGKASQLDTFLSKKSLRAYSDTIPCSKGRYIFLNVTPSTLFEYGTEFVEDLQRVIGSDSLNTLVLEITEHEFVNDMQTFAENLRPYRRAGLRVAIDDFGAGYGGLKMLSILEPDFVKIDKHFFTQDDKRSFYKNLIDSIATICHRNGIEVIAEGIETSADLQICLDFGIDLVQGYLFARPEKNPLLDVSFEPRVLEDYLHYENQTLEVVTISQITQVVPPLQTQDRVLHALESFQKSEDVLCIPVLDGPKLFGILNRHRFMEKHMVGRFGYGMSLNYYRTVQEIVDRDILVVPHYTTVEQVAKLIQKRNLQRKYDDICVTRSGKYVGTVSVGEILRSVTDNGIRLARGANPLSGLPGTEFIKRRVDTMLSGSIRFDISSIDIDGFKNYNDHYGVEKGDQVISVLGDIVDKAVHRQETNRIGFSGHIGGDDFIVITRPKNSLSVCQEIIEEFTKALPRFHKPDEIASSSYTFIDRDGRQNSLDLLSVSIGIVGTEHHGFTSFAEVVQNLTHLKNQAKKKKGSVIVADQQNPLRENGCA